MTPVQIAYFKHFLFDMGLQAVYISKYRRSRLRGDPGKGDEENPESLEEFLQQQPPSRVLLKAFYFQMNSNYGYDYWKGINNKWIKYLDLYKDNPKNERVVVLKGTFQILRQNWDSPQYWKSESMEATYARMHIEPPLEGVDLETAFTVPTNSDYISRKNKDDDAAAEAEAASEGPSKPDNSKTPSESLLEGFSLIETNNKHCGRKIGSNTVSVNLRNNGYRVTFASKQSDRLRKHGYKYVKLLTKKETGEIALVFNNQSGCNVVIKRSTDKETRNVTINSKEIVEHIIKFYTIKPSVDYFILNITDTIQQDLNMIYKLKLSE
jgi:hypothetical protein